MARLGYKHTKHFIPMQQIKKSHPGNPEQLSSCDCNLLVKPFNFGCGFVKCFCWSTDSTTLFFPSSFLLLYLFAPPIIYLSD